MKNFEWENKENGTFFLHGDRWSAFKSKYTNKVVVGPNYNLPLGQKVTYTKAMKKTLESNWAEILRSITHD